MAISKKAVFMILLIVFTMALMSVFSPIAVYAVEGEGGGNKSTKSLFSDFNINVSSEDGETKMTVESDANGNAWQTLLDKYKGFITGIAAVGAVTMVVLFIIQFLKLGASAGNPSARSQALVGVLWTGIAAAGLGAVAIITGIFYNAI